MAWVGGHPCLERVDSLRSETGYRATRGASTRTCVRSCVGTRSALSTGMTDVAAILAMQPQLSGADRETYEQICSRLHRAQSDKRRAEKRGDAKKLAAAERAITRAKQFREAFVSPRVGHLWAPARIIGKFESRWSGPDVSGIHRQECEMVLDHKDLSGPSYRTVRVLKDEDGPPTNARSAPDTMGVAWFAIADQIKSGKIVVLGDEEA